MIPLGAQVKIIRALHNIRQAKLAKQTGIDRRVISGLENGKAITLKDEDLQKLATYFQELGVKPVVTIEFSKELSLAA